jgi:hypothetical protein
MIYDPLGGVDGLGGVAPGAAAGLVSVAGGAAGVESGAAGVLGPAAGASGVADSV